MVSYQLPLQSLSREPGRHVWLLPYAGLPFQAPLAYPERLTAWRHVATTLARRLSTVGRLDLSIDLLSMNYEGTKKISAHGAAWMPVPGLGIWPQGRSPHFLATDDVYAMDPQKPYVPPFHPSLRVGEESGRASCWEVLLGYGGLVALFQELPVTEFVPKSREVFVPMIDEVAFHAYPEYLPLLDAKVSEADPAAIAQWLCGAKAYLRDSPQDGGLLIVSREPIDTIFSDLKFAPARQAGLFEAPLEGLTARLSLG